MESLGPNWSNWQCTINLCLAKAAKAGKKPNILVLWGDDIGVHNISAYNHGIMGYGPRTSTGLQRRGHCSLTLTPNRVAPQVGRRSFSDSIHSVQVC